MANRSHKKPYSLIVRVLRLILGTALTLLMVIVLCDAAVEYNAKDRLFYTVEDVPFTKVGLLLGTSKYSSSGKNLFYLGRIKAAVDLYNAGKIEYILISGDNATESYNEPKQFRKDLIALGVPSENIILDYAGFRTLDSVVRSKEVFQEKKVTIISQQFHIERAIFIADAKGLESIGFCARDVEGPRGINTKVRERLARVQMVIDLILGTGPKFLGDPIPIGEQ